MTTQHQTLSSWPEKPSPPRHVQDLRIKLEQLEHEFHTVPDEQKDFDALQTRLEQLLNETSSLAEGDRGPLLPILKRFQSFLQEHLSSLQEQSQSVDLSLERATPASQVIKAYTSAQKVPKKTPQASSHTG